MDPISLIVTCLAIWGILQRAPALLRDAVNEWRHAAKGEESPKAEARRQRLIDAGIDPASGGPMRQFASNWWRDFWLDLDRQRQEKAAARRARGEESSWADRVDEEAARRSGRRPSGSGPNGGDPSGGPDGGDPSTGGGSEPDGWDPNRPGSGGEGSDPVPPDNGPQPPPDRGPSDGDATPDSGPRATPPPDDDRGPTRVKATVGEPIRYPTWTPPPPAPIPAPEHQALPAGTTTAVLEGDIMSAVATNGTAVTGVISGAAETAAIARQLEAATQAYIADLIRIRSRINALGDQTLAIVQFAGASTVVQRMAQAAEAAAAAQSAAANCGREVGPLLLATKREFDKRNS